MGDLKLGTVTPDAIKFGALDVDKIFQGDEEVFGASTSFEIIIAANVIAYNIYNELILLGWDGVTPGDVLVTINPGVYVYSTDTLPGLTTGPLPAGSTVEINNLGFIMGFGGTGGVLGSVLPAGNGFNAIDTVVDITIDNQLGYIGGGGGGGGSGGGLNDGIGGGGAGGGGGIGGGGPGEVGLDGFPPNASAGYGGRILPGVGGAAVVSVAIGPHQGLGGGSAGSGGVWTLVAGGGASGAGGSAGAVGGPATGATTGDFIGGGGGGWGASGGTGWEGNTGTWPGGLGGKAVELTGNIITWVGGAASSSRAYGAVS